MQPDSADAFVRRTIEQNHTVVFGRPTCPYCNDLVRQLDYQKWPVLFVNLDTLDAGAAVRQSLQDITKQRTIPNVWVAQKFVGGHTDMMRLLSGTKDH